MTDKVKVRLDAARLLGFDQVNGRANDARLGAKIGNGKGNAG